MYRGEFIKGMYAINGTFVKAARVEIAGERIGCMQ